jgi:hypothetical protein
MNDELPTLSGDRRQRDVEQLKLLGAFHFVGAGLAVLGMLMLYGHYATFSNMINNPKMWMGNQGGPPPAEMFAGLKWFYAVFAAGLVGTGVLNLLSGIYLRARRHRAFSFVVAGINCFYMPIGTALGIFTFIVLVRDSVRRLYQPERQSLGD